jgi:hypothetical protein
VLDGAHHLERQFLSLRQAFDAGNVESFVWTVAAQRSHVFTVLQLPKLYRSIIAAASEKATVRTGAQGLDRSLMSLARPDALSVS